MRRYTPKQGDFIYVNFDPQSGHEQRDRRPALIISNTEFNKRTGMAFVCPVTSRDKGFPFHVPIGDTSGIKGFVMAEQIKSIDFRARDAQYIDAAPEEVLDEVLSLLDACLY